MAAVNYTTGRFSALGNNGRPLIGGLLYTYQNGTTTPAITYADPDGTTPNANPIVLDARGEAQVFLDDAQVYRWVLHDSKDALIWSQDAVTGAASSIQFNSLKEEGGSSLVGFIQAGAGAVPRTVQDKLRERVSLEDYRTVVAVDDTAAFEAAISAVSPGGMIEALASRAYTLSDQIKIDKSLSMRLRGVIRPAVNAAIAGTAFFLITASDVCLDGEKLGAIDGISTAYSNWAGIYASTSERLENVHVRGFSFKNLGIDNTAAFAANLDAVDGGSMTENRLRKVGVLSNVFGGGYGLYMQYCADCTVENNTLREVGSSGINNSCGTNNTVQNNRERDITLFGFKGGYGENTGAVTNDVAPTTSTFSITADANSRKRWIIGASFTVKNAALAPTPIGYVGNVVDNGTYLTIFCSNAMTSVPDVGAEVQMLENGTDYIGNTLAFSGDNGWDINGWTNITIAGNALNAPGARQSAGIYNGVNAGFWLGYDPQGPGGTYNQLHCEGLTIVGNTINNAYKSAIAITAQCDNLNISANTLVNYNRSNSPDRGGIEVTKLSFYRSKNHSVKSNHFASDQGFAIYCSFAEEVHIVGNTGRSNLGIVGNSISGGTIRSNRIKTTQTGTNGYGILISQTSGNSCSDLDIDDNTLRVAGEYGIHVSDTNAVQVRIGTGNDIRSTSPTANLVYDESSGNDLPVVSGFKGRGNSGFIRIQVPPSASIDLAEFFADNGTIGGAFIEGVARSGFSNYESFRVVYSGNVVIPAVSFTSLGSPNGTSFLSAGMFTLAVNSPAAGMLTCNYTNSGASTVFMTLNVRSLSRN